VLKTFRIPHVSSKFGVGGVSAKSVKALDPLIWQPTAGHRADNLATGPIPPAPGDACPLVLRIDRTAPGMPAAIARLAALLAPEERLLLTHLRHSEDRERFLLGRGVLRQVLAHWMGLEPGSLTFSAGPFGKPALAGSGGPRFNVAHSGDLVLLGFHPTREVGVDVELLRPQLEWQWIARRCLPEEQCLRLEGLPAGLQLPAFLEAWCRLEAVLKARGVGLSGLDQPPPDGVHPAEPAEELWSIALPEGYCGAAALA
jgi:4'-phosphopantetheinyl transferase